METGCGSGREEEEAAKEQKKSDVEVYIY